MICIANPIIYGLNGQILSSGAGYGGAGASRRKRSMKGFDALSGSPAVDIDAHNPTLRQRTRMLYMASPIATSAIRTVRTNVVGSGLKLKARLNREVLRLEANQAVSLEKLIEAEFGLWGNDKRACDATGVNDFDAMQQLAMISWSMSGDSIGAFKYHEPTALHPYSTRVHIIEADRISTPMTGKGVQRPISYMDGVPINPFIAATEGITEEGNVIHDGVEISADGAIVAYHICNGYPIQGLTREKKLEWVRVEAYGNETGLPNVLHVMDAERPDQYRGVPYLAHVIEPLLQLRRYTESELMAALVESFFTAFIKTEVSPDAMPFNEVGESGNYDPHDYEMGPGVINVMNPGESVDFGDPKRPTSGFETFVKAVSTQVGAALEIPADLLLKQFDASYSASRAALLEAWKAFKMRRVWFVADFCRPVYEVWFSEAVAIGRINAPGFFNDPIIRAAWLGSEWIGPSQGQLDPVKEITAEILAIGEGISTREQSTTKLNGGSWDSNVEQLSEENRRLREAQPVAGEVSTVASTTVVNTVRGVLEEVIKEMAADAK